MRHPPGVQLPDLGGNELVDAVAERHCDHPCTQAARSRPCRRPDEKGSSWCSMMPDCLSPHNISQASLKSKPGLMPRCTQRCAPTHNQVWRESRAMPQWRPDRRTGLWEVSVASGGHVIPGGGAVRQVSA